VNKYPREFVAPPAYDFDNPNMDKKSCHIWYVCGPDAHDNDDGHCMFCQGGLSACVVCGGLEGALTTQCPGRRLTEDEIDRVYGFLLDFNHNRWWEPSAEKNCRASSGFMMNHTCGLHRKRFFQSDEHSHDGKPCVDWAHCSKTSDAQK
jgi:hypothetical protein